MQQPSSGSPPPAPEQIDTLLQPTKSAKRQRTRKPASGGGALYQDSSSSGESSCSLLVRSTGPVDRCASMTLRLTAPAPEEECSIAMEPMNAYRLPFVPASFKKSHLIKDQPSLTKATLPCGHSFSALALVYHFLKNSMTCPCCRAGKAGEKMGEQSVPQHMRRFFSRHLARTRTEEEREQIASDAMAAAQILQHEVSSTYHHHDFLSLSVTRLILSLYPYATLDSSSSPGPMLVLELPLISSLTMGMVESVSYGYSLHQANLNLRMLPHGIQAFELAVGVKSLHRHEWGSVGLFRTTRFAAQGPAASWGAVRVIPAAGLDPRLNIDVQMAPVHGCPQFARIAWRISVQAFTDLLISTSQALAMGSPEVAAV